MAMDAHASVEPSPRLVAPPTRPRERRRDKRFACSLAVEVRGRSAERVRCLDVSHRGLLVEEGTERPLRHVVQLALGLPSGPITVMANVVRRVQTAAGPALGVVLVGLGGPAQRAWDAFIRDVMRTGRAGTFPDTLPPFTQRARTAPASRADNTVIDDDDLDDIWDDD